MVIKPTKCDECINRDLDSYIPHLMMEMTSMTVNINDITLLNDQTSVASFLYNVLITFSL